jgi:hypothetical protein
VDGGQCHAQAEGVRGHVAGVGQQGERTGDDPDGHLDDEEADDQRECDQQRALVAGPGPGGGRTVRVRMPMPALGAMGATTHGTIMPRVSP